jgi:paraquat-inducible protein A
MLVACHDCDLLQEIPPLPARASAKCPRCGALLRRQRPNAVERTLALAFAGLVLFAVAVSFPFLAFDLNGNRTDTNLITGVQRLYEGGYWALAGLVLLTSILAPFLRLSAMFYVFGQLYLGRVPWKLAAVFRFLQRLQPWSMMEVFMLGILVSLVKLAKMAEIIPGLALWSFMLLILVLAAASAAMDADAVWERVESRG